MVSAYELKGKINIEQILNITSRGESLCIIIPRTVVTTYGLISGDHIKVALTEFYRKKQE